jgi:GTPase involved in cell partitioning and DNA repair
MHHDAPGGAGLLNVRVRLTPIHAPRIGDGGRGGRKDLHTRQRKQQLAHLEPPIATAQEKQEGTHEQQETRRSGLPWQRLTDTNRCPLSNPTAVRLLPNA